MNLQAHRTRKAYSPECVEGYSRNFRRVFCAIEHIHFPKTRVCYLRYVASRRRVKAQDGYLSSFQIRGSYPTNYLPL